MIQFQVTFENALQFVNDLPKIQQRMNELEANGQRIREERHTNKINELEVLFYFKYDMIEQMNKIGYSILENLRTNEFKLRKWNKDTQEYTYYN